MSEPNPSAEKEQPLLPKQRCRHIKTGGEQCRSLAMTGNHYCWHHRWYRKPHYTGVKGYDRVAFLEDVASVQLILSQSMQGLIDRTLDPTMARTLFYGCQVASGLVRLDMNHQRWLVENKQQPEEPVREATDIGTDPLAPAQEYRGPDGQFEPYWSFSKYMYEQQCEQAGRPKPTCPADMPPSGWMDEEEYFEDPAEWNQRYDEKIKAAREEVATRTEEAAGAPLDLKAVAALERHTRCAERRSEPCILNPRRHSQKNAAEPNLQTPTVDLQPAAALERDTRCAERRSEPCTLNPDPCRHSQKSAAEPNLQTPTGVLQAVAAPTRYTLHATRCRPAVMRDAHYLPTAIKSNNYTNPPHQGSQQSKNGLNRAGS
ncbi:MAG TPA: hypothetical protein VHZ09_11825 [Acidobacteriaceae bacterium]|jgi:hypothetical protein|nr:hypothetical protein [Acidobacteriaceae bacterium]